MPHDTPPSPDVAPRFPSPAFRARHEATMARYRAMLMDEEPQNVRELPDEVLQSEAFRGASLALRMVHQEIRPPLRNGHLALRTSRLTPTAASVVQMCVTNRGIWLSEEEAEALVAEAVGLGLWAKDGETVVIYAGRPPADDAA